jgi:hypothetical protein
MLGSATVAVGAVPTAVGVGVVTVPDEPPHAASIAANPRAVTGIQGDVMRVTDGLR